MGRSITRHLAVLVVAAGSTTLFAGPVAQSQPASTQPAAHYYNDPANINPDPNYTPGSYPVPDAFNARTVHQMKKEALVDQDALLDAGRVVTLGIGELTFFSIKNESATVQGYFRNYFGTATIGDGGLERLELLVDINSLDTAVPGRNHRILSLFFNSEQPQLGTCTVELTRFDLHAHKTNPQAPQSMTATGTIQLNGVSRAISCELTLEQKGKTWLLTTAKPISLMISDFAFGDRVYDLMKDCNHKSMGDKVEVKTKLYLR